jgi:hypothetical protein
VTRSDFSPVAASCLASVTKLRLTRTKVLGRLIPESSSPSVGVLALVATRAWAPYKVGDVCPLLAQLASPKRSGNPSPQPRVAKRSPDMLEDKPAKVVKKSPGGRPRMSDEEKRAK